MTEEGERRSDYRGKPWRLDIWIVGGLMLMLAAGGWFKVGAVAQDIQKNRQEFVRDECEDVNNRHDSTIAQLDVVLAKEIKEHPERADRIKANRESTVALIDALVPVRNCDDVVERASLSDG